MLELPSNDIPHHDITAIWLELLVFSWFDGLKNYVIIFINTFVDSLGDNVFKADAAIRLL